MDDELCMPLDAAGFSGRACPACGGHFRIRGGAREARLLASALAARVDHGNAVEVTGGPPRHCPYCGLSASPQAFWTEEQARWLEAQAGALLAELRWRRLKAPLERLAARPLPTYLAIRPTAQEVPPPRDPPGDLVGVPVPCCGEELQVSPGWAGPIRCHLCGFVHARAAARDLGLELALLRDWMATR